MEPPITIGRIVHYKLSLHDVRDIRGVRSSGAGNSVEVGQIVPALVVRVWGPECANLRLFLDGSDELPWVTSVSKGDGERQWVYPPRA